MKALEWRIGRRRRAAMWPEDRLGDLERWYAAQPIPRVAAVVVEVEGEPFEEDRLRSALGRLMVRHRYALGRTLVGDGDEPSWRPLDAAAPSPCGPCAPGVADVWRLTEEALVAPFPRSGPLWRVRWLPDLRSLVACFDHVIADGVSTVVFARELLRAYQGEGLPEVEAVHLPLEWRLDVRPTLGTLLREVVRARRHPGGGGAFHRGPATPAPRLRTLVFPLSLPRELVDAISDRARAERTTVHGALCAAALVASARHAGRLPATLRMISPISLRRLAAPEPTGFGVFLCALETDHHVGPEQSFWRLAEGYRRQVAEALPAAYQRQGLLSFAGSLKDLAARTARSAQNGRTSTVEVSNLGRVALDTPGVRIWFAQGNHYHGPLFNLSVVTSSGTGEMNLCLAVAEPLVDAGASQAFLRALREVLEKAVARSDLTLGQC